MQDFLLGGAFDAAGIGNLTDDIVLADGVGKLQRKTVISALILAALHRDIGYADPHA